MSRFLVTGAAGFLGSHLVERLLEHDHDVMGLDRLSDYYARDLKMQNIRHAMRSPRYEFLEADLTECNLHALLDGLDGVFHLAAQPGVRPSWGRDFDVYVRDNITATQRLFDATPQGVRVVFASSSSVYGNASVYPTAEQQRLEPISPYGVTKQCCEALAHSYAEARGLEYVALRFFTVYGPRQRPDMAFTRIAMALLHDRPFHINGTGEQVRDFTYVDDAVAATEAAMESPVTGRAFNVGGGAETSLLAAIESFEECAGRRLRRIHTEAAPGDVWRTGSDTAAVRSALAWTPQTTVLDGIRAQFEWAKHELVRAGGASA